MPLIAAIKTLTSCIAVKADTRHGTAGKRLEQQAMLDELRGLFADELAAHDRSARALALQSTSHRAKF